MTVKEAYDWAGSPSTWGDPVFKNNVAAEDSLAVARLKNAGAVIFGKPMCLAIWRIGKFQRHLRDHQQSLGCHPRAGRLLRRVGGGPGGRFDRLGSRQRHWRLDPQSRPLLWVYGHKPTFNILRSRGVLWPGELAEDDLCVIGPLARSADDLEVALQVMAGPDPQEAVGWRLELPAAPRRRLSDFKVGVMLTDPNCVQDDALTGQLQNTVDALARAGVTVVEGARPAIDTVDAFRTYLLLLRSATGAHTTADEFAEHAARAATADPDDWSYRTVVDRGVALSHYDWLALNEKRYRMMEAWDAWFGNTICCSARSPPRPLSP